jgi:hypothetical protein
MPSLRRSDRTAAQHDDDRTDDRTVVTRDDTTDTTVVERDTTTDRTDRTIAEQAAADRAAAERAAAEAREAAERAAAAGRPADRPEPERVTHPRARASVMATIGLVLAVAAALIVATGTLAALGVGVGVVALLFTIGGFSAASRPHVTGRMAATVGLLVALAAVIIGVLALTGTLSWLDTGTDQVARLREWLDSWRS